MQHKHILEVRLSPILDFYWFQCINCTWGFDAPKDDIRNLITGQTTEPFKPKYLREHKPDLFDRCSLLCKCPTPLTKEEVDFLDLIGAY